MFSFNCECDDRHQWKIAQKTRRRESSRIGQSQFQPGSTSSTKAQWHEEQVTKSIESHSQMTPPVPSRSSSRSASPSSNHRSQKKKKLVHRTRSRSRFDLRVILALIHQTCCFPLDHLILVEEKSTAAVPRTAVERRTRNDDHARCHRTKSRPLRCWPHPLSTLCFFFLQPLLVHVEQTSTVHKGYEQQPSLAFPSLIEARQPCLVLQEVEQLVINSATLLYRSFVSPACHIITDCVLVEEK